MNEIDNKPIIRKSFKNRKSYLSFKPVDSNLESIKEEKEEKTKKSNKKFSVKSEKKINDEENQSKFQIMKN